MILSIWKSRNIKSVPKFATIHMEILCLSQISYVLKWLLNKFNFNPCFFLGFLMIQTFQNCIIIFTQSMQLLKKIILKILLISRQILQQIKLINKNLLKNLLHFFNIYNLNIFKKWNKIKMETTISKYIFMIY